MKMRETFLAQLLVAALTLIAVACGDSPTGPESDVPNFQGVWQGTWSKASCAGVLCDIVPSSGGFRTTLTQSGTQVQGTVEFAQFVIPASGTVNPGGGALSLTGTATAASSEGSATATLSNWSTTRNGNTLSGSFTVTIVLAGAQIGPQVVVITLQNVTKTS